MLPLRTVTKKQKKEASRKRLGISLVFTGLLVLALALSFAVFFEKDEKLLSPLSKDQTSSVSMLEARLKEKNIKYSSIETGQDLSFMLVLSDGKEAIIDPDKNIDQQLSSLQLILKQLKIEGRTFKRLDFRFKNPVISN